MTTLKEYIHKRNITTINYFKDIYTYCKNNNIELIVKVLEYLNDRYDKQTILDDFDTASSTGIWDNKLDPTLNEICIDNFEESMYQMANLCKNDLKPLFKETIFKKISHVVAHKVRKHSEMPITEILGDIEESIAEIILTFIGIFIINLELEDENIK